MALEGTLSDFGIAEILQLIGTQQKTGILYVEGQDETEEVQIYFRSGKVIRCEVARRDKRDLIGNMLLAADLITKEQLADALSVQKKTLKRVGDVLVEQGTIPAELLQELNDLQTRETLFKLFEWKSGRYRFESKPPNFARPSGTTISSETLLMEGVRMMDEWPLIRARITSYDQVFKPLRSLDESESEAEALERILDDAFSEFIEPGAPAAGEVRRKKATGAAGNLGRAERRVFPLVDGKRTVAQIIDRSRLGEFETCKALIVLQNEGYLAPVKAPAARPLEGGRRERDWGRTAVRVALNVALLGGLVAGLALMPRSRAQLAENGRAVAHQSLQRLRANRILATEAALEVFRLEEGAYPERLEALIERRLLGRHVVEPPGQPPLVYLSIGSDYDLR